MLGKYVGDESACSPTLVSIDDLKNNEFYKKALASAEDGNGDKFIRGMLNIMIEEKLKKMNIGKEKKTTERK